MVRSLSPCMPPVPTLMTKLAAPVGRGPSGTLSHAGAPPTWSGTEGAVPRRVPFLPRAHPRVRDLEGPARPAGPARTNRRRARRIERTQAWEWDRPARPPHNARACDGAGYGCASRGSAASCAVSPRRGELPCLHLSRSRYDPVFGSATTPIWEWSVTFLGGHGRCMGHHPIRIWV